MLESEIQAFCMSFPQFPQSCIIPENCCIPPGLCSGALLGALRVRASLSPDLLLSLGVPGDRGDGVSCGQWC